MYTPEEFDLAKQKVLKYIMFKKRSKAEVKNKFSRVIESEILNDLIDELEENGYIDDNNYISRSVDEFININNLSIKEVKYKLMTKGISSDKIDDFFSNNYDILYEYELNSARKIKTKKEKNMDEEEIKAFLLKKGYRQEIVKEVFED